LVVGILLVTALGELARMAMPQSEKTPP
jgi:hypothetical protein